VTSAGCNVGPDPAGADQRVFSGGLVSHTLRVAYLVQHREMLGILPPLISEGATDRPERSPRRHEDLLGAGQRRAAN